MLCIDYYCLVCQFIFIYCTFCVSLCRNSVLESEHFTIMTVLFSKLLTNKTWVTIY